MHLVMILAVVAVAWGLRLQSSNPLAGSWRQRFERALFLFLFPPLLLLITAIAVLCMGPQGQMIGLRAGWFSYVLAASFLGVAGVLCLKLGWQGWRSIQRVHKYPRVKLENQIIRILNTDALFAGQIGFWQPDLVVSQGLLETLSPEHLQSVLTHEQGHYYYRDTFWFFWLGWLRECTAWLPNTNELWQELLVLRELRADNWAALRVDPLLLAESLLMVVSDRALAELDVFCAALAAPRVGDRLEQRIDALLTDHQKISDVHWQTWAWFLLAFLPLTTVMFHN